MMLLSRRFLAACLLSLASPALSAPDPVAIGTTPNNGQGDPLRVAAIKLNKNDADLYAAIQAIRSNIASLAFAPLVSPNFTGVPRAPTPPQGTTGTQIATVDFVSTASAGRVPTSRQILSGGLATGGGDLTANRTITVPKAAQSDVATGTDDAKALTSLSIAAALGAKAPYTAVVRTDVAQSLVAAQRILAKQNIGAGPTGIQSTSASMTLDGSAAGKLIFTGTAGIVITLPTVAQIGSDQSVAILNTASGTITAASQGSSNIFTSAYGGAALSVPPGALLIFQNDGTNWVTSSPASTISPAFTGTPTAPTPAANDNSTKVATTAYADRAATAAPYVVAESLGANGYRRWSTGFTEQWGTTSSTSADFTLTFPTAFANNCWGVTTNPNSGIGGATNAYVTSADSFTKTTAILRGRVVSNGGAVGSQANLSIVWRAWGN